MGVNKITVSYKDLTLMAEGTEVLEAGAQVRDLCKGICEGINVYVNGQPSTLDSELNDGDKVTVAPITKNA